MWGLSLISQVFLLSVYVGLGLAGKPLLRGNRRWLQSTTDEYISVAFSVDTTEEIKQIFIDEANFWNGVIAESTVPAITLRLPVSLQSMGCAITEDYIVQRGETINGLLIVAEVIPIDKEGGVLGQAAPCVAVRDNTGQKLLPRAGFMQFDIDDFDALVDNGSINAVIRHEMGHVLGIGSLWQAWGNNLVQNPCPFIGDCTTDPSYTGSNGIEGFNSLGGSGQLDVADQGGGGTRNAHWREATFQGELMTGFLSGGNQASIMTLQSMIDLGYIVNLDAAEDYTIPGTSLPPTPNGTDWENTPIPIPGDTLENINSDDDNSGRSTAFIVIISILGGVMFCMLLYLVYIFAQPYFCEMASEETNSTQEASATTGKPQENEATRAMNLS
mmetsp:Transcript_6862/g.8295  ORF Transcript_6862/g.8295 Transcript_6862/m.8295 type:complete len:386 (+) Transcript_6862:150-1307(+)